MDDCGASQDTALAQLPALFRGKVALDHIFRKLYQILAENVDYKHEKRHNLPVMINRTVKPSKFQSFFLFGARGTGKSTLLRRLLSVREHFWVGLLEAETEARYLNAPQLLLQDWQKASAKQRQNNWVVIDEVQKAPRLLDVVHLAIERHGINFAMTGSSARKLRRGAANLLAGRAVTFALYPFSARELGLQFDLDDALNFGMLPRAVALRDESTERKRFLHSYVNTYLREEVQAEGFLRKFAPFRSFLQIAASASATVLNISLLARQTGVDKSTVQRYFSILEDTLIGFYLPAFSRSTRMAYTKHPKFYFFDTGVARAASLSLDTYLRPATYEFGRFFEHFVVLEIIKENSAHEKGYEFFCFRTDRGAEIDIIANKGRQTLAIEIKSTPTPDITAIRKLARLSKSIANCQPCIFCRTTTPSLVEGVHVMPWQQGIAEFFSC